MKQSLLCCAENENYIPLNVTLAITAENTTVKFAIEILQMDRNEEFSVRLALLDNFSAIDARKPSMSVANISALRKPPDAEISISDKTVIRLAGKLCMHICIFNKDASFPQMYQNR